MSAAAPHSASPGVLLIVLPDGDEFTLSQEGGGAYHVERQGTEVALTDGEAAAILQRLVTPEGFGRRLADAARARVPWLKPRRTPATPGPPSSVSADTVRRPFQIPDGYAYSSSRVIAGDTHAHTVVALLLFRGLLVSGLAWLLARYVPDPVGAIAAAYCLARYLWWAVPGILEWIAAKRFSQPLDDYVVALRTGPRDEDAALDMAALIWAGMIADASKTHRLLGFRAADTTVREIFASHAVSHL